MPQVSLLTNPIHAQLAARLTAFRKPAMAQTSARFLAVFSPVSYQILFQYILSPTARLTSYPSPGQSCLLAGPYTPRLLAFPVTFAHAAPSLELSPPLSKSCLLNYFHLNQAPVRPGGSLSLCPSQFLIVLPLMICSTFLF